MMYSALAAAVALAGVAVGTPVQKRAAGGVNMLYWGADSYNQGLAQYCKQDTADVIALSFVNEFGRGKSLHASFGGCSVENGQADQIPACQQLASDVKTCQSAGIKVLISLGGWGSTPPGEAYGLESQSEAEKLADDLWNLFGGGSSNIFGGTKVDGLDLDIEGLECCGGQPPGADLYQYMLKKYKTYDSSAIFSASMRSSDNVDINLGPVLTTVAFDYVNVQFYNNYHSAAEEIAGTDKMNFDDIHNNLGASKGAKILIGLPAGDSAPGPPLNYHVSPKDAATIINKYSSHAGYGGAMVYSAGWSDQDTSSGCTYSQNIQSIVKSGQPCQGSPYSGNSQPLTPAQSTTPLNDAGNSNQIDATKMTTLSGGSGTSGS